MSRANLHQRLRDLFPAHQDGVQYALGLGEAGTLITAYGLLSDGFVWGVFHPAAKAGDEAELRRCYAFVEELLATPDEDFLDAVEIRVISYMTTRPWWPFTKEMAGARLAERLPPDDYEAPDYEY